MKADGYELRTVNGYALDEVVSALQKEIRRGKEREALYWGHEMAESGFAKYLWRRLFVISNEDVSPEEKHVPCLVWSLYRMTEEDIRHSSGRSWKKPESLYFTKAIMMLCRAKKSRVIDLANEYVRLERKQGWKIEIPEYALDVHTERGRKRLQELGLNPSEVFYKEGAKISNRKKVKGEDYYLKEVLKLNGLLIQLMN